MPKFNATPYLVAAGVGVAAVGGWWLWRRNRAQAGVPPTVEILAPPAGTSSPSGTRIDFSARAMGNGGDISNLIQWSIIEPAAGLWSTGATTFIIPSFLTTQILTMEARVIDPATGLAASAQRSVTITVTAGLATVGPPRLRDREPTVLSVVRSFRRSDTGWQVKGRHVLEEPFIFARR